MSINTTLIGKGLKRLVLLIALLFISPILLNIAFKALDKYPADSIWIAYIIFVLAIILTLFTLYLAFKTFAIFLAALFNDK